MILLKLVGGLLGLLFAVALVEDLSREPWVLRGLIVGGVFLLLRRWIRDRPAPLPRTKDDIDPRYRV